MKDARALAIAAAAWKYCCLLLQPADQLRPIGVAAQHQRGVDDVRCLDAGRVRRARLAQHIDGAERQRAGERLRCGAT